MISLDQAKPGMRLKVIQFPIGSEVSRRLMEFGLFEGDFLRILSVAPMGDPIELEFDSNRISLRKSEVKGILVDIVHE